MIVRFFQHFNFRFDFPLLGGASSPQLVVSLPPLNATYPENGSSGFPPLPDTTNFASAAASGGAAASPDSPMSLTEDEMQHERNAFAENVNLGLYQPIPTSAAGGAKIGAAAGKSGEAMTGVGGEDGAGMDVGSECTVCYERAVDSVLYTCGHCCMCYDCAWECKQTRGGLCPICRAQIRDVIRIYRS